MATSASQLERSRSPLLVGLLALGVCGAARAAPDAAVSSAASAADLAELRVRGGVSIRGGSQETAALSLQYAGWTPSSASVDAWVWPLLRGSLGLNAGGGREGVGLYDATGQRVLAGSLVGFRVAPSFRYFLGPFFLEARVGYAYDTLLAVAEGEALRFAPVTRHSLLGGARLVFETRYLSFELRGEAPVTLASSSGAKSSGLGVGAALRVPVATAGAFAFGALVEGGFGEDRLRSDGSTATSAVATAYRVDVGLSVAWRDPSRVSSSGRLRVELVDADSRQPLTGAVVEARSNAGNAIAMSAAGAGAYASEAVAAGGIRVTARLDGYVSMEGAARVPAAGEATVSLAMQREAPKTGALAVRVTAKDTGAPVADARVRAGNAEGKSDADGRVKLEGLSLGATALTVEREGYLTLTESAMVAGGLTSDVVVQLLPEKKRIPATLSGRVRSARRGTAIAASLSIPQAGVSARAAEDGSFSFELPPGSYTITISAPGFTSQTKLVSVNDAEQAIFNVDLIPR